jgi:hypothetical protein
LPHFVGDAIQGDAEQPGPKLGRVKGESFSHFCERLFASTRKRGRSGHACVRKTGRGIGAAEQPSHSSELPSGAGIKRRPILSLKSKPATRPSQAMPQSCLDSARL